MNPTLNPSNDIWIYWSRGRLECRGWSGGYCRGVGMKCHGPGTRWVAVEWQGCKEWAACWRKINRALIFAAEGEKEVKYTINLGKLLSIYKIAIMAMFYRFATWINKKTFVKCKKSPAYKCNWDPLFGTQMAQSCPPHSSSQGPRQADPASRARPRCPLFLWPWSHWACLQTHILNTSCPHRVYILLVQHSVMVSGQNSLEYDRSCQNILGPSALFPSTCQVPGLS